MKLVNWAMISYCFLFAFPSAGKGQSALQMDRDGIDQQAVYESVVAPNTLFDPRSTWIFFSGLEGSKQPQDLGVNANFGGRVSLNFGRLVKEEWGLGIQLGTSINGTGNAVQVFERVSGDTGRFQSFTTVGVFQRDVRCWNWGLGYDFLYQAYYDQFFLGQWRGRLSRKVTPWDELGAYFAIRDRSDYGEFAGIPFQLRPLTQGSICWRRNWESGTQTGGWVGLAASHSEVNVTLGDLPAAGRQLMFGSDIYVPLNRYFAVYGEANILMPADTGAVDAFLGIEFSPRGFANRNRQFRSFPVLPVANNTSFIVDARR